MSGFNPFDLAEAMLIEASRLQREALAQAQWRPRLKP
jgi:hypothetical protein